MEALIKNFGIQPILLVAQIVNFLIIFYLLKRFAWKPILKVLSDRKTTVAESIKNAELADKRLAEATEKEKALLRKAQIDAQTLLADAKIQAQEIHREAETHAKTTVEKMIRDGQKKIEEQTKEAELQLTRHVTHIATGILEKSLTGLFDAKEQKSVLAKAAKRLKA